MILKTWLAIACVLDCAASAENRIWYDWSPTVDRSKWTEALPIGNGKFGAMVYGHPTLERLQLNEDSLFSGGQMRRHNPDAAASLPEIRSLLANDQVQAAQELTDLSFTSAPVSMRHYEPLGDLWIAVQGSANIQKFERWLDLNTAIAGCKFDLNGVGYTREVFASAPDDLIVAGFNSSSPTETISFTIRLDRRESMSSLNVRYDKIYAVNGSTLVMSGSNGGRDGMTYAAAVRVVVSGGSVRSVGDNLIVTNANKATIFVAADTTFRSKEPEKTALNKIQAAQAYSFAELRDRHIRDHSKLYDRVALRLGTDDRSGIPTWQRWDSVRSGQVDHGLTTLMFNYGRYMLIASSRPGSLPANLQGIWNQDFDPSWGSRYTININTQMNYWPAEVTNLAELHQPLFDHLERMRKTGKDTAQIMYNATGWMSHHNTDVWGDTAPQDRWMPGSYWTMSSGWLCLHVLEHYWFTGDHEFIRKKMPTVLEAVQFYLDTLQVHKGYLVTNPSVSPENTYRLPNGQQGVLAIGPTIDNQILWELFKGVAKADANYQKATRRQLVRTDLLTRMNQTLARLPPMKIGKFGNIQEWIEDYDEVEPGHRHISHLFGLYPGTSILEQNTALWQGAKNTIQRRLQNGGAGTGWSRVWVLAFFARLGDSAAFAENVMDFFKFSTYVNLFDSHPPFQADGNYGFTAAIAESLIQSHWDDGTVFLLPSYPSAWPEGQVSGLVARGGFVIDMAWNNGVVTSLSVTSTRGGPLKLRFPKPVTATSARSGTSTQLPSSAESSSSAQTTRKSRRHVHFQYGRQVVESKGSIGNSANVTSSSTNVTSTLMVDTVPGTRYMWTFSPATNGTQL